MYIFSLLTDVHRHCLGYTYELLLRDALDTFHNRWNLHRIRPNKKAGRPSGVPDDLYQLPHLNGIAAFTKCMYCIFPCIGTRSFK